MGKKPVNSIVQAQAVALSDSGLNQVQISRQLNISKHCVQNAVKKYKETRQYNDFPRTDRPKKNPNRGVRHLKRLVKDDGCLSAAKIISDLNGSLPKPVLQTSIYLLEPSLFLLSHYCIYLFPLLSIPIYIYIYVCGHFYKEGDIQICTLSNKVIARRFEPKNLVPRPIFF